MHAVLGEDDQAIAWLEKDLDAGNTVFLVIVTNTYVHDRLHDNPRYKDFLRRMGLKVFLFITVISYPELASVRLRSKSLRDDCAPAAARPESPLPAAPQLRARPP